MLKVVLVRCEMKTLKDLSISQKILGLAAIMFALVLVLAGYSAITFYQLTNSPHYPIANQSIFYFVLAVLVLLTLLTGLGLGYRISSNIKQRIDTATALATRISEGDFSTNFDAVSTCKDETGALLETMESMARSLQNITHEVLSSADQIATAAKELSLVTDQNNQSIYDQQSSTQQVAAAVTEMATTVQEVTNHAVGAAEATQQANIEANKGASVVQNNQKSIRELVSTVTNASEKMDALNQECNDIGGVVDVINSITEQTNLLALNAAIEAAHAGEHGLGFSVVAEEVRSLAQRTQESTLEIQKLVERLQVGANQAVEMMDQSRSHVEASAERAIKAGQALEAITQAVMTINDMNSYIAAASEQQSSVAEEINQKVVTISQTGNRVLGGSQQTTRSSEDLANLASGLRALMGQFKLTN